VGRRCVAPAQEVGEAAQAARHHAAAGGRAAGGWRGAACGSVGCGRADVEHVHPAGDAGAGLHLDPEALARAQAGDGFLCRQRRQAARGFGRKLAQLCRPLQHRRFGLLGPGGPAAKGQRQQQAGRGNGTQGRTYHRLFFHSHGGIVMDLGIAGKWALVCGASKGLGLGCAQALVREGVNVVMVARGVEALEAAVQKLIDDPARPKDTAVQHVAADITTPEGRAAAFEKHREYDIVVTNAGGPPPGDFRDWDRDAWVKALDANMLTPIELIKATVDGMAARGFGRIINITSSSVKAPIDVLGLSNGLTGFVAGVARTTKLASANVTINNLLPGVFDTDRIRSMAQGQSQKTGKAVDEILEGRRAAVPARRLGTPDEFGATCAFLCSQYGSYITGQNILLDGGAYPGTY
jgi:3-oxoacyl-[acyl-carrier protein] reductase